MFRRIFGSVFLALMLAGSLSAQTLSETWVKTIDGYDIFQGATLVRRIVNVEQEGVQIFSMIAGSSGVAAPGSNTQVVFNDNGQLGADAGLVFNKTTDQLTLAGPAVIATAVNSGFVSNIVNSNAGAAAFTELDIQNEILATSGLRLVVTGMGFTPTGIYGTDAAVIAAESNLTGGLTLSSASAVTLSTGTVMTVTNTSLTPKLNFNLAGAPALGTCGDRALATGSSNTSGRVTGTTQTACTLTFSVAFPNNSTDCYFQNLIANRGFINAASTTAFTVTGLTAGDDFMYMCVGR